MMMPQLKFTKMMCYEEVSASELQAGGRPSNFLVTDLMFF